MGDATSIQWTDATWNPVRGCSKVSPGCKHCYAEKVAARFCGPGLPYDGLADPRTGLWTGKVRMVPEHLADPLRWQKPRRIFVNSMSDLFHEGLSNEEIAAVFGVMAAASHHTFQVLTKRAERMREWFGWVSNAALDKIACIADDALAAMPQAQLASWFAPGRGAQAWPLPNVWLGVSTEDQTRAEERIPALLNCPAAVRFLSIEPQLGPVDLTRLRDDELGAKWNALEMGIHWVIVGGESGPGARPFDLAWAESLVAQCQAAGVACFVKQLGAVPVMDEATWRETDSARLLSYRNRSLAPTGTVPLKLGDTKGGDPAEWPEYLRVREFPEPKP